MKDNGRPPAFNTPEEFEEKALDYIKWVKENPMTKTITSAFRGEISFRKVPHMRGMTQFGLAAHMGIGLSTLKDYGQKEGFSAIYGEIDAIMKAWNLDGALSGDLNHALVARIDGHADKQDHVSSDGSMGQKPTTINLVGLKPRED